MNDELNCEEANQLLAAYALDSLVEEERCAFLAHLAECRQHDDELASYRAVTSRLPAAIDPVAPPSQLRSNLLRNFDSLVNAPAPPEPLPTTAPRRGISGLLRTPSFAYGLAAALAVIAIALGTVAITRDTGGEEVTRLANEENGRELQMTYLADRQTGILNLTLPALPANRAYQAWQITDAGPVSLGVVAPRGPTAFAADLSRATAIAITEEPAGGSAQPTTTPFLVTKL